MRDPHVVALHYKLETGPQLAFHAPAPVVRDTTAFSLRLDNGALCVELRDHFATAEAARREVEPYLRSWEIVTAIQYNGRAMRFVFDRAQVVDRPPPPPGSAALEAMAAELVGVGNATTLQVTRRQYPNPPDCFVASADVVSMWDRYEDFLAGKERLTHVAWWCLTTITRSSGSTQRAAARYAISHNVLATLARLAHVGDEKTARKRFPGQVFQQHTPAEIAWMQAAVRRVVLRVGECAYDPIAQWPQITMEDFPKL